MNQSPELLLLATLHVVIAGPVLFAELHPQLRCTEQTGGKSLGPSLATPSPIQYTAERKAGSKLDHGNLIYEGGSLVVKVNNLSE